MSSKPDKGKYGENIEDTTKNVPGQNRQPGQQSGQPDQPDKTQKNEQGGQGIPRSGQR
jgi:hypothetical protein